MNKKPVFLLIVTVCLIACLTIFAGCFDNDSVNDNEGTIQQPDKSTGHNHSFGEWTITEDSTCTAVGKKERVCACGEKEEDVILKKEHSFGEWEVTQDATCISFGVKTRACIICGEQEASRIAKSSHAEVVDEVVAPTCITTGLTKGSHCSVCGEILIRQQILSVSSHAYGEWVIATPVGCTENGLQYHICVNCGDVQRETIYATGHKGDWNVIKEATCTETGKRTIDCQTCLKTITESIAAKGHSFSDWTITKESSCGCGQKARTCDICALTEKKVIEPDLTKQHEFGADNICIVCNEHKATEGLIFEIKSDYAIVTGYNGTDNDVYIPSTYAGAIVKEIAKRAFAEKPLTSITIPDSVTSIGESAFYDCNRLTSIIVLKGNIKYHSADNCLIETTAKKLVLGCNNSVIPIDGSVTSIESYAFYKCSDLTSIIIPDYVTNIGRDAFYGCSGLLTISMGNGLISIPEGLLSGCSSLQRITIPFVGAEEYNDSDGNKYPFGYIFGKPSCIDSTAVLQYYEHYVTSEYGHTSVYKIDTYYYIPSTLKTVTVTGVNVPYGAFMNCSGLTSITIPDSVTSIGGAAFSGCSGLSSITIPFIGASAGKTSSDTYQYPFGYIFGTSSYTGGTRAIQYYYGSSTSSTTSTGYYIPSVLKTVTVTGGNILRGAFYGCSELMSITIPDSVTSIEDYAFTDCQRLTSIVISDSVIRVGYHAFAGCIGLKSVTIGNSVMSIEERAFAGCSGLKSVTIGNSVMSIEERAFAGCSGLASVTIGNSVTSIGNYAFTNCNKLTSIYYAGGIAGWCEISGLRNIMSENKTLYIGGNKVEGDLVIPNGVTSIGNYAFSGCSGLTSITIPDSVTSIGDYAFNYCSSLTSITIPDSVTSIGNYAFYNCSGLMSVTIPDSVTSIGSYAFYNCSGLISANIPDSVTSIKAYTFYKCSGLVSITIPDSVTSIDSYAFTDCSGLTSITIGKGITSVSNGMLFGCSSLQTITIPFVGAVAEKTSTDTYQYPFGYIFGTSSYAGSSAVRQSFYGSSTHQATNTIFYIPSALRTVTVTGGNILYGAFNNCSGVTSVTIGDSVTSIGGYAFNGCSGLTSVTIDNSVTSIGDLAFYNCSGLTSINIPDSVTRIGNNAFYNCSGLTSINIPDSVTRIGGNAFYNCSKLTTIIYQGTISQWNAISKVSGWDQNTGSYVIHCTDGDIAKE